VSIFDKYPDEIARFESLLDTEDDRTERKDAVENAIRIAESLVAEHPNNADAHQCLGLAWYHFPESSSWRSWHCRRSLERALAIDPDHQFAQHYLACQAFDQERYQDALGILQLSRFQFFCERDQEWRALKNEELKIVCTLRLFPQSFPSEEFIAFRERFRDAQRRENEDISSGSWVCPQELREHVEWMIESGVALDDARILELVRFLSEAGLEGSFWNTILNTKNGDQDAADQLPAR
jgi:hypothetical protein